MTLKPLQHCQSTLPAVLSSSNRSVQRNLLVLAAASFSLGIFGLHICSEKNSNADHLASTSRHEPAGQQADIGKWTYDEIAHKLIFEYCEKSRQQVQQGFGFRLGSALLKVSKKIDQNVSRQL